MTIVAWWTVRLPGHGLTALIASLLLAVLGGALAVRRVQGLAQAARDAGPVFVLATAGILIPFVAEGHFGVLGTGFNVDMSQHLFAADWIANPDGAAPGLLDQGYPLGPHGLAVATRELTANPVTAFSGVTVALPVIAALTALAGLGGWTWWRMTIAAALTAFAYLVASYLAQGAFKELFEVCFLLGFVLWLGELRSTGAAAAGWRAGLPGAVLAAGALYAYSAPGLAWLGGTLVLWAGIELARERGGAVAAARRAAPIAAAGIAALLALAAPELDRIADFGGSVGTVSEAADADVGSQPPVIAATGDAAAGGGGRSQTGPEFDNDLGNLFGQISPLEGLGIWPTGDFRVAPGDGAVPAGVFYAAALLGAIALTIGIAAALRSGETAMLAALAAALAIWIAARIGSTPYTTAKALALLAPVAMLVAARGVLRPRFATGLRDRSALLRFATCAAFVAAASISSALVLAKAPVGPSDYTPGVRDLSERFAGRATVLLAPEDVVDDEHGAEFYAWELREATPACVTGDRFARRGAEGPPPFERFVTVGGEAKPPYPGLRLVDSSAGVTLWSLPTDPSRISISLPDPGESDCAARLG